MPPTQPLRVGIVPYLNMLPLVHGLDSLRLPGARHDRLEIHALPPSRMTEMLDRRELDLGMAPVGALLDRPNWQIVGKSMIGSFGPVRSVLAISRQPPAEWTLLHPDAQSRTSNILVRVILAGRHNAHPAQATPIPFQDWEPPARPAPGEAFTLIGTRAIRWRDLWRAEGGTTLDLGQEWTDWTGLPFVFAVWALRTGAEIDAAELDAWMEKFETLKAENFSRLDEIIAAWPGLAQERQSPADARDYLTKNIRFNLDATALQGLNRFRQESAALGLVHAP